MQKSLFTLQIKANKYVVLHVLQYSFCRLRQYFAGNKIYIENPADRYNISSIIHMT